MKKIGTFILMLVMCFVMSATAFAVNITVDSRANRAMYFAYKLLNSNSIYTVNEKYRTILQEITGKTEDTDIVQYISNIKDNAEEIRRFENNIYEKVKFINPDAKTTDNVFSNIEQGFYLIVGVDNCRNLDINSLIMLDSAGQEDIIVKPKQEEPILEKQVRHNDVDMNMDQEEWGTVGDYQIGDIISFRILTTVPPCTEQFEDYSYIIYDTMSAGLTSNVKTNENVSVLVFNRGEILSADYYTVTVSPENSNSFSIDVDIVKAMKDGKLQAGDSLYFYYTGTLNENAVVYTEGNQDNGAYLEYSIDPSDSEKKESTPTKKTYVWTFKMEVNKMDGDGKPLTGAKFVLSQNGDLDTENLNDMHDRLIPFVFVDGDTPYYRPAVQEEIEAGTNIVYEIEAGDVMIKGLDDCIDYYLYETKAPDGYNALTEPTHFQITEQGYGESGDETPTVTVSGDINTEKADIINNTGARLPSTGGMGTIIFYAVGGTAALLAGILLIIRKRMTHHEE